MNENTLDNENSAGVIILITVLLTISYSVLRYHIAGPVPWKDFPMFILNKGLCLARFILLTFNFSLEPPNNLGLDKGLYAMGSDERFFYVFDRRMQP